MTMQVIFTIGLLGVIGLGVFMFFLLGIIETICEYKKSKRG